MPQAATTICDVEVATVNVATFCSSVFVYDERRGLPRYGIAAVLALWDMQEHHFAASMLVHYGEGVASDAKSVLPA